jgi:hypothetical protein
VSYNEVQSELTFGGYYARSNQIFQYAYLPLYYNNTSTVSVSIRNLLTLLLFVVFNRQTKLTVS